LTSLSTRLVGSFADVGVGVPPAAVDEDGVGVSVVDGVEVGVVEPLAVGVTVTLPPGVGVAVGFVAVGVVVRFRVPGGVARGVLATPATACSRPVETSLARMLDVSVEWDVRAPSVTAVAVSEPGGRGTPQARAGRAQTARQRQASSRAGLAARGERNIG
jgi:hypothetical protein